MIFFLLYKFRVFISLFACFFSAPGAGGRAPRAPRGGGQHGRGVVHMSTAWHETCSGDAHCEINFESRDGKLFADGTPFNIKGVNW